MSKIFNFLNSGTYSSLGVNFFRFPFGFGERGRRGNPKEQQLSLEEILEDVEKAIHYLNRSSIPLVRARYLNIIQLHYNNLKKYEGKDERARQTREES
jgi:hypothetical protein